MCTKYEMSDLCKYFKRQSLPTSPKPDIGLPEIVTEEANTTIERILEKECNGVGWRE